MGAAAGDGWLKERDGEVGVVGLDGLAGAEYERDPRLPPLPARAHASPTCPITTAETATDAIKTKIRCVIALSPSVSTTDR